MHSNIHDRIQNGVTDAGVGSAARLATDRGSQDRQDGLGQDDRPVPVVRLQGGPVTAVTCLFITIVLLCWAFVSRPQGAQCPPHWYVDGVRPSGSFRCRPVPAGNPDNDGTWGHRDTTPFDDRSISGQLYCSAGLVPLVLDERTVGCRRVAR
jgi:hypothetical protein